MLHNCLKFTVIVMTSLLFWFETMVRLSCQTYGFCKAVSDRLLDARAHYPCCLHKIQIMFAKNYYESFVLLKDVVVSFKALTDLSSFS